MRFEVEVVSIFREQGLKAVTQAVRREMEGLARANLDPQQTAQAFVSGRTNIERGIQQAGAAGALSPQQIATLRGGLTRVFNTLPQQLGQLLDQAVKQGFQLPARNEYRSLAQSGGAVYETRADAAARQSAALANRDEESIRAGQSGRVDETIFEARQNAVFQKMLAESEAYQGELRDAQVAQQQVNAAVATLLAADDRYARALTEAAVGGQQIEARQRQMLAVDDRYIRATAAIATARDVQRAAVAREQRGNGGIQAGADAANEEDRLRQATEARRLAGETGLDRQRRANVTALQEASRREESLILERLRLEQGAVRSTAELAALKARRVRAERRATLEATEGDVGAEGALQAQEQRRRILQRAATSAQFEALPDADALIAAQAQTTAAERRRAAQVRRNTDQALAVDRDYIDSTAAANVARHRQRRAIEAAELGIRRQAEGETDTDFGGRVQHEKDIQSAMERRARLEQQAADPRFLALKNEERRLQRQINSELRRRENAERASAAGGRRPDVIQRAQAFISRRTGQEGSDDPNAAFGFQNTQQFLGGKLLTSAGFLASAVTLRGTLDAIGSLVSEAEELERILNQVEAQFESIGQGDEFESFRGAILDIAADTGRAADEVAFVAFQIKGVFGEDTAAAIRETEAAIKIAAVTGLELREVVDSLTAASLSFDVSIEDVGDKALGLQERFGVLASESIKFFGDIGATAAAAGLDLNELGAIAGVLQQNTGRAGAALAEGLGRILPAITQNAPAVLRLFSGITGLQGELGNMQQAFAEGKTGDVLLGLARSYDQLEDPQRRFVENLLGGRREAQIIIPILQNYAQINGEIADGQEDAGRVASYFADLQTTLSQAVARAREEFRLLGEALFRAGLGELLGNLAVVGGAVIRVLRLFVGALAFVNEATFGLGPKILTAVLAVRLLGLAFTGLKIGQVVSQLALLVRQIVLKTAATTADTVATARNAAANRLAASVALTGGRGAGITGFARDAGRSALGGAVGVARRAPSTLASGLATPGGQAIAMVGALAVFDAYNQQREQLAEQAAELRGNIRKAYQANDEAAVAAIEDLANDRESFSEMLAGAIGFDTAVRTARDESNRLRGADLANQLGAADKAGVLEDVIDNEKGFWEGVDSWVADRADQFERFNPTTAPLRAAANRLGFTTPGQDADSREEVNQLDDLIRRAREGDATAVDEAQKIIDRLNEQGKGDAINAELGGVVDEAEKALADADPATAFEGALRSVEEARRLFESGQVNATDYLKTIRQEISNLEGVRDRSVGGILDPEQAEQLANLQQTENQTVTGIITGAAELAQRLADMSGTSTPASDVARARALLNNPKLTDPQARLNAALGVVDAQKAQLDREADEASSLEERLAVLQEGKVIDGQTQQAIRAQIAQLYGQAAADRAIIPDRVVGTPEQINAAKAELNRYNLQLAQQRSRSPLQDAQLELDAANAALESSNPQERQGAELRVLQAEDTVAQARAAAVQADRQLNVERARLRGDIMGSLREELQIAQDTLAQAAGDEIATAAALGQIAQAEDAIRLRGVEERRATLGRRSAETEDPEARAALDIQQAQLDLEAAQGDPVLAEAARGRIAEAQRQARDEQRRIVDAQIGVSEALNGRDALGAAQDALRRADEAARRSTGAAGDWEALALRIQADRQMQDAMEALQAAQVDTLRAMAERAGDSVEVARLGVEDALRAIALANQQGAGPGEMEGLQNNLRRALTSQGDAVLQRTLNDIQFELDMGRITRSQAIERLRASLSLADSAEEVRDIQRQIRQLQQSAGQDLQFNIGDIKLPTIYEARRLMQSQAAGVGYQEARVIDNRVIEVTNHNYNAQDYEGAIAAVADEMDRPPVVSATPRIY